MENREALLINSFHESILMTIEEIKKMLQTTSRMTAFRRLKRLPYRTSYSHGGKYYTLDTVAHYDSNGIWSYNQVYFSKFGTLKNTVLHHIERSLMGYTCYELEEFLKIPVYNTVSDLWKRSMINRKQIEREYLYLSLERGDTQFAFRKQHIISKTRMVAEESTDDYLALFMSLLNEKQQRLFAGYESMKLGYGGDEKISQMTGLNVKTVSRGRKELLSKNIDMERIRKKGAGRPSLKKTKKF